jgi:hypothetical protein
MNMNINSSTQPARPTSGVEQLNHTLDDLRCRINATADRINALADQFGTSPSPVPPASSGASKPPETTNEHMACLDTAMRNLESITSRIDNQ